jgi:hypothetical protein
MWSLPAVLPGAQMLDAPSGGSHTDPTPSIGYFTVATLGRAAEGDHGPVPEHASCKMVGA